MTTLPPLTLDVLTQAVAGGAAALRSVTRLAPAGGDGDKVFPPTYATGDRALRYAMEERMVDGERVPTVLLDSVASQANRFEEALYAGWEAGELDFPVIAVDFRGEEGLEDLDRVTTLHAPHRIADAILRDAVDGDGRPFRETPAGRAYTEAGAKAATAIYRYCPTALVFGVWDSTGPRGGSGNKIQRALVSEIVGFGATPGKKTASRIDPLAVGSGVPVYHRRDDDNDWTIDPAEAATDKGKPRPFSRSGGEGKGKPSAVNHSNIAPSIDEWAGGVTLDHARQTTVLSLVALRKLRFPVGYDGRPLDDAARRVAEPAARTALAALALAGFARSRDEGLHLRSRCLLVPTGGDVSTVEVVPGNGDAPRTYALDGTIAAALLREAAAAAAAAGLGWERAPVTLRPAPKLARLVRESRRLDAEGRGGEDNG